MKVQILITLLLLTTPTILQNLISASTTFFQDARVDSGLAVVYHVSILTDAFHNRLSDHNALVAEHIEAIDLGLTYIGNTLKATEYSIETLGSLMVNAVDMGSTPKDKQANVVREILRKLQRMKGSNVDMLIELENILTRLNKIEEETKSLHQFLEQIENKLAAYEEGSEQKPVEFIIPASDPPYPIEGNIEEGKHSIYPFPLTFLQLSLADMI